MSLVKSKLNDNDYKSLIDTPEQICVLFKGSFRAPGTPLIEAEIERWYHQKRWGNHERTFDIRGGVDVKLDNDEPKNLAEVLFWGGARRQEYLKENAGELASKLRDSIANKLPEYKISIDFSRPWIHDMYDIKIMSGRRVYGVVSVGDPRLHYINIQCGTGGRGYYNTFRRRITSETTPAVEQLKKDIEIAAVTVSSGINLFAEVFPELKAKLQNAQIEIKPDFVGGAKESTQIFKWIHNTAETLVGKPESPAEAHARINREKQRSKQARKREREKVREAIKEANTVQKMEQNYREGVENVTPGDRINDGLSDQWDFQIQIKIPKGRPGEFRKLLLSEQQEFRKSEPYFYAHLDSIYHLKGPEGKKFLIATIESDAYEYDTGKVALEKFANLVSRKLLLPK